MFLHGFFQGIESLPWVGVSLRPAKYASFLCFLSSSIVSDLVFSLSHSPISNSIQQQYLELDIEYLGRVGVSLRSPK